MPEHFKRHLIIGLLLGIFLLPLIFIALRRGRRTVLKNLMSGCAMFLLLLVGCSWVILALIRFAGLEMEWRGGYVPIVTWHKTKPDFGALERSRSQQTNLQQTSTNLNKLNANWPGFRGANDD